MYTITSEKASVSNEKQHFIEHKFKFINSLIFILFLKHVNTIINVFYSFPMMYFIQCINNNPVNDLQYKNKNKN